MTTATSGSAKILELYKNAQSRSGGKRGVEINGMSWEGQLMPPSMFDTVVATPTVGNNLENFGVIPTAEEFRNSLGRNPDAHETPHLEGLRPFHDSTGSLLVEVDKKTGTEKAVATAMHLYITPEKRRDVLLRLKEEDRGGYLAIWTLLDINQMMDIETFGHLLSTDDTLLDIQALKVTDDKLNSLGNYGVLQGGSVRRGASSDGTLGDAVSFFDYFEAGARDASARKVVDEAGEVPAEKVSAAVSGVVESEEDEMKRPVQEMPIKYKVGGSMMNRKCAYVKFNDAARHCMVAYAIGEDSDEFDEGTELSVIVEGRNVKCEAGPVFEVPEAGVNYQIFKIKE